MNCRVKLIHYIQYLHTSVSKISLLGFCIVSRYIECIDTLVTIWLTIYRIKSIDSHDMYQNIFFVIKSLKVLFCYIFTNLLPILFIFDPTKYIAIHIVYRLKVSTIRYISDQYSDTELFIRETI